ncbi:hypothetical protein [Streptomyces wuyuanensis]|uniref:hypothetical protein n=1 Tax=Streptomyces wuyuanensis TaxID=1196353 RepID=UPI0036B78A33
MNDRLVRDELVSGSALLQTPRQAPPIDRTAAMPAGTHGDTPGVEANIVAGDEMYLHPWLRSHPFLMT